MTERERFLATFAGEPTDRPPLWEEGIQEETLAVWRLQGMPSAETPETRFRLDRREMVEVNLEPLLAPLGDGVTGRRGDGARPPDPSSRPVAPFARLRQGYRVDEGGHPPRFGASGSERQRWESRLPADWERRVARWVVRDYPLGLTVSRGLFRSLEIGDWNTLVSALYALCDEPEEVEATMESATGLSLRILERVLAEVSLDFALFNEPIASFHAPVVSPAYYRRFMLPHLRRLVTALRSAGVPVLIVQSYGQVEPLIPLWREVGIDVVWCYHAQPAGIDYRELRRRHGRDLRLIGGIPTAVLLQGQQAIEEALATIVAPLLAEGGYLPMLDDRVRVTVPYESYCCYRARLEQLVDKAALSS